MDTANKKEHAGTSVMKVSGILLIILSVVFCIVAVNTKPVLVLIEFGIQNRQEVIQARIFYFALSGTCLLAGVILAAVGVAMEKVMKQNKDVLAAIKQLSASVVYMRLIDKRKADRRQQNIPVEEERRLSDRRAQVTSA